MKKGFFIAILFLLSGIVLAFIPWALPNGGMAEIFGTKIPAWLGFVTVGMVIYLLTDRGTAGKWVKNTISNKINSMRRR